LIEPGLNNTKQVLLAAFVCPCWPTPVCLTATGSALRVGQMLAGDVLWDLLARHRAGRALELPAACHRGRALCPGAHSLMPGDRQGCCSVPCWPVASAARHLPGGNAVAWLGADYIVCFRYPLPSRHRPPGGTANRLETLGGALLPLLGMKRADHRHGRFCCRAPCRSIWCVGRPWCAGRPAPAATGCPVGWACSSALLLVCCSGPGVLGWPGLPVAVRRARAETGGNSAFGNGLLALSAWAGTSTGVLMRRQVPALRPLEAALPATASEAVVEVTPCFHQRAWRWLCSRSASRSVALVGAPVRGGCSIPRAMAGWASWL